MNASPYSSGAALTVRQAELSPSVVLAFYMAPEHRETLRLACVVCGSHGHTAERCRLGEERAS
jgi:hypothetical protein